MQNIVSKLIEDFLETHKELWLCQLADHVTEFHVELALEDYLLAHGVEFSSIDVHCSPDEITVDVYGEFEEVDYLAITKEVMKTI